MSGQNTVWRRAGWSALFVIAASVAELEKSIAEYLAAWNEQPRPFIWTATVGKIAEKLARAREKLETIKPGCTQPRQRKKQANAV